MSDKTGATGATGERGAAGARGEAGVNKTGATGPVGHANGVTKSRSTAITSVLLFCIVAAFSISAFGIKSNGDLIRKLDDQIAFLCTTSGSLALVMDSAADQIDTNFKNGTYDNLLQRHIITAENIAAARTTRDQYREQVKILTSPSSPCLNDQNASKTAQQVLKEQRDLAVKADKAK